MKKLIKKFRAWWRKEFHDDFTVVCDTHPLAYLTGNIPKHYFFKGCRAAHKFAVRWIRRHSYGVAFVCKGIVSKN